MRGNERVTEFFDNALNDVCFGRPEDTEAAVRRYFTESYLQTTDGETSDFCQFVEHVSKLRSMIREGHIEVIDALQEGVRIAERHIVRATKNDGKEVLVEVFLFGILAADGRLERVWEITRPASENQTDEDCSLARIR